MVDAILLYSVDFGCCVVCSGTYSDVLMEDTMAENDKNKENTGKSGAETNPLKAVKTTSLPTKHEFSHDESKKNLEKRKNDK